MIRRLDPSALIYDCASNFRAHPNAPKDFAKLEKELLHLSDLVVCDSDFLYEQKCSEHAHVVQIHQGVSDDFFAAAAPQGHWRNFCYYGTWSQDLNAELVTTLCDAGCDVTVSGFSKGSAPLCPSQRLLPARREDLVKRLEQFEAFLLYRINTFLLGVVP